MLELTRVGSALRGIGHWALTDALTRFHLSAADPEAGGAALPSLPGGGSFGALPGLDVPRALRAEGLGADAATLRMFSGLREGLSRLAG